MGQATNVKMGVCNITFDGNDLGYTQGGVKIDYSADTVEKTVDQQDAPIGEVVTKQKFEVKVPMAEYDLARLTGFMPGATLQTSGQKQYMLVSGASGVDLTSIAKTLVITPIGGSANDAVTVFAAVPQPKISFGYEKDKIRVFEVAFTALVTAQGLVAFGDSSIASILTGVTSVSPNTGVAAGGTGIVIAGWGFTGKTLNTIKIGGVAVTGATIVNDGMITAVTGAHAAGATTAEVALGVGGSVTLAGAFTYV